MHVKHTHRRVTWCIPLRGVTYYKLNGRRMHGVNITKTSYISVSTNYSHMCKKKLLRDPESAHSLKSFYDLVTKADEII